jgi:hypothetical protein
MRKHPLIAFFVLAYLLTWWIYPLLRFSPLLGIPGLSTLRVTDPLTLGAQ